MALLILKHNVSRATNALLDVLNMKYNIYEKKNTNKIKNYHVLNYHVLTSIIFNSYT